MRARDTLPRSASPQTHDEPTPLYVSGRGVRAGAIQPALHHPHAGNQRGAPCARRVQPAQMTTHPARPCSVFPLGLSVSVAASLLYRESGEREREGGRVSE
jgi:hypothetical protein